MSISEWQLPIDGLLKVDSAQLEFSVFGPPPYDAPTIVLLHEGLGSVSHWKNFPEKLADKTGCGVFVYSRQGYGGSSPAVLPRRLDYITQEAVEVLPQILSIMKFQNGILLGHSDGATIAAIYSGTIRNADVRGLILIAPHFFTETAGLVSIAESRIDYETGLSRDLLMRYHRDVDNAFFGWCDAWLDPEFRSWNVADVIDGIRVPILAIQGSDDQYGSIAQIEEIEKRAKSTAEIHILDSCRHSPHREYPARILALVSKFVLQTYSSDCENSKFA